MNQTHTHGSPESAEENVQIAYFGSKSRTGGATHQIRGRLTKITEEDALRLRLSMMNSLASDDLRPPPREIRPVSLLVNALSSVVGAVSVNCDATFEYNQTQGYTSRIALPIPLMIKEEDNGFTHIESAQFSRRGADGIEYQVIVAASEDSNSLIHTVNFVSEIEFNNASFRNLLAEAHSLSARLLILTER